MSTTSPASGRRDAHRGTRRATSARRGSRAVAASAPMGMMSTAPLDQRSIDLRRVILEALGAAGAGHVGPSLSCVEILRALYDGVARHRPLDPAWSERDRILLSKGHGCVALYALLADHGYFDKATLRTFCRRGSILGGHPESALVPGVEFSTGALGHGLSVGVGMALALRRRGSAARVFVVTGDGELGEGSNWEALAAAAHHRLDRLSLVVDRNGVQSSGMTADVLDLEPLDAKLRSFGCTVRLVDGHDVDALVGALAAGGAEGPTAVICRTTKGRGLPTAEGDARWHYRSDLDAARLQAELKAQPRV